MPSDEQSGQVGTGVAQKLRESPLDIVVTRGHGDDIFVKADDEVMILDETEARIFYEELTEAIRRLERY